jgi:hypothetical protein
MLAAGGGFNPQYLRLIIFLIVMGFSFLSWMFRKLQEQAAKKKAKEAIERRELEVLRTGRDVGMPRAAASPGTATQRARSEAERRIEELRRRRDELVRRRAAGTSAPTAAQTPPQATPASAPPRARPEPPPLIFIPGSSGPIVVARPRVQPAPLPVPPAPARVRTVASPIAPLNAPPVAKARTGAGKAPARGVAGSLVAKLDKAAAVAAAAQPASTSSEGSAMGLQAVLRTPAEWRRAIVVRELLSPPISERGPDEMALGLQ